MFANAEDKTTVFSEKDWVKERTSVGEVVKVTVNGGGKEVVTYRMATGQTATQFAEFLVRADPPTEAAAETA